MRMIGFKTFVKKHVSDDMMVQMLQNGILKWTICCFMSFHILLKNTEMNVWCFRGNHFFGDEINQKLTSLMTMWHVHLKIKAFKMMPLLNPLYTPWHHYRTLHQYTFKFTLFFIRFWVKLNKFRSWKWASL